MWAPSNVFAGRPFRVHVPNTVMPSMWDHRSSVRSSVRRDAAMQHVADVCNVLQSVGHLADVVRPVVQDVSVAAAGYSAMNWMLYRRLLPPADGDDGEQPQKY